MAQAEAPEGDIVADDFEALLGVAPTVSRSRKVLIAATAALLLCTTMAATTISLHMYKSQLKKHSLDETQLWHLDSTLGRKKANYSNSTFDLEDLDQAAVAAAREEAKASGMDIEAAAEAYAAARSAANSAAAAGEDANEVSAAAAKAARQAEPSQSCQPGAKGPECRSDSDCQSYSGCVRCAKSSRRCTNLGGPADGGARRRSPSNAWNTDPRRRRTWSTSTYTPIYPRRRRTSSTPTSMLTSPASTPSPTSPNEVAKCTASAQGPACQTDADCAKFAGCVSCVRSGWSKHCSAQPTTSPASTPSPTSPNEVAKCTASAQGPACQTDADCAQLTGCVSCVRRGWSKYCSAQASSLSESRRRMATTTKVPSVSLRRRRSGPLPYSAGYMSCQGLLCGTLALETGLGSGNYKSDKPIAHGLWPGEQPYSDSLCVAPKSWSKMSSLPKCMDPSWGFINHEWTKHGQCAGVENEEDYFSQICSLSAAPLALMAEELRKPGGEDLEKVAWALQQAGYPISKLNTKSKEVYLSACAAKGPNGYTWKLAAEDDFQEVCGQI
eukprot:TRINITY_DN5657_c0_g1_i1.p1 TRINITY_DN5657_c0_g1~~TRINITY_DN5657_c0_g1_i1.p1  ORF type:complete len:555 (+),score=92.27 TRINITY_DN5657_c0_g1_i1:61-1725(+)